MAVYSKRASHLFVVVVGAEGRRKIERTFYFFLLFVAALIGSISRILREKYLLLLFSTFFLGYTNIVSPTLSQPLLLQFQKTIICNRPSNILHQIVKKCKIVIACKCVER